MKCNAVIRSIAMIAMFASVSAAMADDEAKPPVIQPPEINTEDLVESAEATDESAAKSAEDAKSTNSDTDGKTDGTDVEVKSGDGQTSIVVRSFGKIVHISPDGKIEVKELNGNSNDPAIKDLRLNLRDFLLGRAKGKSEQAGEEGESSAKSDDQAANDSAESSAKPDQKNRRLRGSNRIFRFDENGLDIQELENLPGKIAELLDDVIISDGGVTGPILKGQIHIEGPDGTEHRIDIGKQFDGEALKKQIEELLGDTGKIEIEVLTELDEAMQRMRKQFPNLQSRWQQRFQDRSTTDAKDLESIHEKLDSILQRIEKLEEDVSELKKPAKI